MKEVDKRFSRCVRHRPQVLERGVKSENKQSHAEFISATHQKGEYQVRKTRSLLSIWDAETSSARLIFRIPNIDGYERA